MNCNPILRGATRIADGAICQLVLTAEMACFGGHFPGMPVLPGVVQIDWAVRLGVLLLGTGQPVAERFQVKFKRVISPGQNLTLELRIDTQRRRLNFIYRSGAVIASLGHIELTGSVSPAASCP